MAVTLSDMKRAQVTIELDGEEVVLRPTPDAILALSEKYTGFQPLLGALQRLNVQAFIDVVIAGTGTDGKDIKPLRNKVILEGMPNLIGPLSEFVIILANGGKPMKDDTEAASRKPSDLISFEAYASWLVEIGDGWLGWPPGTAEKTDVCRILLAYQGDKAKLKAIYGSADDVPPAQAQKASARPLTPELFKSLFG